MADNILKESNQDRSRVASGEDFEVEYLARKTDISAGAVHELIKGHGNHRATLEREARKLKG